MLKITILGSGNFIPNTSRHCASHLFQTKNEGILFDFGRGAIDSLIKKKVKITEIRRIFISHPHSDHLSEIGAFLGWLSSAPSLKKINHKVIIYGPKGIKKSIEHLMKAFDIYPSLKKKYPGRLKIRELKDGENVKAKGLSITGFRVSHAKGDDNFNSLSYRINYKDNYICYSGDTPDCKGIRKACKNADLAIMECTLPKRSPVKSHLSGDSLGLIANEENINKLVVVHVDKDYLHHVIEDIRKNYKGQIVLAKDLMQFKIK